MDIDSEHGSQLNSIKEDDLMKAMRLIAIRKSNSMVHRNKLRQLKQGKTELFSNFVSRLKEAAIDCKFTISCNKRAATTTLIIPLT